LLLLPCFKGNLDRGGGSFAIFCKFGVLCGRNVFCRMPFLAAKGVFDASKESTLGACARLA
jgi:hypothetical protein